MTSLADSEGDLAKSEDLLRQAAQTSNLTGRRRLIDEAARWRFRARDAVQRVFFTDLGGELDLDPQSPGRSLASPGGLSR